MTRLPLSILSIYFLLLIPCMAWSEQGTVVHAQATCEQFIVQVGQDYAVMGHEGGLKPKKDDQVEGRIHRSGMGFLKVLGAEERSRVWIEAYPVSEKRALELYARFCRN